MSISTEIFRRDKLNVLEIKKWTDKDLEYFEETIKYSEIVFNEMMKKSGNDNKILLHVVFYEIDHLFNIAKLLQHEYDLRDRYLNLILQYLPYIEKIRVDDYDSLEKNHSSLMEDCFTNIPFLEEYIQLI